MKGPLRKLIKLFYCYAHEDKALRRELENHLSILTRRYHLIHWHDYEINAGENWERAIETQIDSANLVLLLISPDFLASEYCCSKEMKRALILHETGTCSVVPIILRPTDWEEAPFSHLQILPEGAKAITSWSNRDEAFENVARSIRKIVQKQLNFLKTKNEWFNEGHAFVKLKRFEEAFTAYHQASLLDPKSLLFQTYKCYALNKLERYDEALALCEHIVSLDPQRAFAYTNKSHALDGLSRYEEALAVSELALRLDPGDAMAYNNKGYALHHMGRYQEALEAYEQAVQLNLDYAIAYANMSLTLEKLNSLAKAQTTREKAHLLDHDY